MLFKERFYVHILLLIFLSSLATSGIGQTEQASQVAAMKMALSKHEYLLGEPIELHFFMKNLSLEPFTFAISLTLVSGGVDLAIEDPLGNVRPYTGLFQSALYPVSSFEISSGEVKRVKFRICFDREKESGYVFDIPGTYRLICTTHASVNGESPYHFNLREVSFNVVEPQSPSDKAAQKLVWNKSMARVLHETIATTDTIPLLREIVMKYPESPYAPFAFFSLAIKEVTDHIDKLEKVTSMFERMIQHYSKSSLLEDVLYNLASCYDKQDLNDKASKTLMALVNTFPDTVYYSEKNPLFFKYVYLYEKMFAINEMYWVLYDTTPIPRPDLTKEQINRLLRIFKSK